MFEFVLELMSGMQYIHYVLGKMSVPLTVYWQSYFSSIILRFISICFFIYSTLNKFCSYFLIACSNSGAFCNLSSNK